MRQASPDRRGDNCSTSATVVRRKLEYQCLEGRKTAAKPRKMGTLWVHNAKAPRHSLSLYAHWFLLCKIILHADLLRTDVLGNFRWCCNVLAIENSSLFCLKRAAGAFFSSFTGSTTDCYLIYIQCMSWLAGTSGNFRGRGYLFFLIVTNLLRVTNLPVSHYIPSDLHYLIFLLPVFILSWWALYYWGGRTQVEKRGEARLFSFLNPWPATERKKIQSPIIFQGCCIVLQRVPVVLVRNLRSYMWTQLQGWTATRVPEGGKFLVLPSYLALKVFVVLLSLLWLASANSKSLWLSLGTWHRTLSPYLIMKQ